MGFTNRQKEIIRNIRNGVINNFASFVKYYYENSKMKLEEDILKCKLSNLFDPQIYEDICNRLDNDQIKYHEDVLQFENNVCQNGFSTRKFTTDEKKELKEFLKYPHINKSRYKITIPFDKPIVVDILKEDIYVIEEKSLLEDFQYVIQALQKLDLGVFSISTSNKAVACCCFEKSKPKEQRSYSVFKDYQEITNKYELYDEMYGNGALIDKQEIIKANKELILEFNDIIQLEIASDSKLDDYVERDFCTHEEYSFKKSYKQSKVSLALSIVAILISILAIILPFLV